VLAAPYSEIALLGSGSCLTISGKLKHMDGKTPAQFILGLIPNPLLAEIHGKALGIFLRRGKQNFPIYEIPVEGQINGKIGLRGWKKSGDGRSSQLPKRDLFVLWVRWYFFPRASARFISGKGQRGTERWLNAFKSSLFTELQNKVWIAFTTLRIVCYLSPGLHQKHFWGAGN